MNELPLSGVATDKFYLFMLRAYLFVLFYFVYVMDGVSFSRRVEHILVIQCFRVLYHGMSQESLFLVCTQPFRYHTIENTEVNTIDVTYARRMMGRSDVIRLSCILIGCTHFL